MKQKSTAISLLLIAALFMSDFAVVAHSSTCAENVSVDARVPSATTCCCHHHCSSDAAPVENENSNGSQHDEDSCVLCVAKARVLIHDVGPDLLGLSPEIVVGESAIGYMSPILKKPLLIATPLRGPPAC